MRGTTGRYSLLTMRADRGKETWVWKWAIGTCEHKQTITLDRGWSIRNLIDTYDSLSQSRSPFLPHNIIRLPKGRNVRHGRVGRSKAPRTQKLIIDDTTLHAVSVKPLVALLAGDVGEVRVVGLEAEAIWFPGRWVRHDTLWNGVVARSCVEDVLGGIGKLRVLFDAKNNALASNRRNEEIYFLIGGKDLGQRDVISVKTEQVVWQVVLLHDPLDLDEHFLLVFYFWFDDLLQFGDIELCGWECLEDDVLVHFVDGLPKFDLSEIPISP